ncbi:hypothetical protein FIBSPDRAFT_933116 [Athelia psychrophila]|uniref:F-box domain-containing protein n=1 Tax=Athelia psychrophila TaxID=1759441 RepID=A0A166HHX4_9AGAM|nr:hypothetical protein FIBSPDRAFT_933116 [Fibularhizoctonia sp. CBS 109695]
MYRFPMRQMRNGCAGDDIRGEIVYRTRSFNENPLPLNNVPVAAPVDLSDTTVLVVADDEQRRSHLTEILSTITEELAADVDTNGLNTSWGTLANLATTCSLLSETSLNSLWKFQNSLLPVLLTMPSDLWDVNNGIIALACAKPRAWPSLCSEVRILNWAMLHVDHSGTFRCMPFFMGEHTTKVVFNFQGLQMQDIGTFQSLLFDFPRIQSVTIPLGDDDDPLMTPDALLQFFTHGKSLQKITVDLSLPRDIIKVLASAIHLRHAEFLFEEPFPSSLTSLGFQALQVLVLHCPSPMIVTSFLRTLSNPPLKALAVKFTERIMVPELLKLFHVVRVNLSHKHLERVVITTLFEQSVPNRVPFRDEGAITPLVCFSNLTHIDLDFALRFRIGNKTVQDIARAWPLLQVLRLGGYGWQNGSQITPSGVLPLLRLPHLRTLSIAIDASSIDCDIETVSPNPDVANNNLEMWDLQDSPLVDYGSMAALLSAFIPRINRLMYWQETVVRSTGVSSADAKRNRK